MVLLVYRGVPVEVRVLSKEHFVLVRSRATALAVAISGRATARRLRAEPWSDSPTVTSDSSPTVRQVRQSDSPTGPTVSDSSPTVSDSNSERSHVRVLSDTRLSDEGPTGPTGPTVRQLSDSRTSTRQSEARCVSHLYMIV